MTTVPTTTDKAASRELERLRNLTDAQGRAADWLAKVIADTVDYVHPEDAPSDNVRDVAFAALALGDHVRTRAAVLELEAATRRTVPADEPDFRLDAMAATMAPLGGDR